MQNSMWVTYRRILSWLAALVVLKVTGSIVAEYWNYWPPNFSSDFLRSRESYFWHGYHLAFYVHIATGPVTLVWGTFLVSETFRRRWPHWHRVLGRLQVVLILLLLMPSGLWMAFYAGTGTVAGISFATLTVATTLCTVRGWRTAVRRRFANHRRWMWRTYILLCSAVVLRLVAGIATVIGVQSPWFDPIASWACWVIPFGILEIAFPRGRGRETSGKQSGVTEVSQLQPR